MKKSIILIFLLGIFLVGCSKKDEVITFEYDPGSIFVNTQTTEYEYPELANAQKISIVQNDNGKANAVIVKEENNQNEVWVRFSDGQRLDSPSGKYSMVEVYKYHPILKVTIDRKYLNGELKGNKVRSENDLILLQCFYSGDSKSEIIERNETLGPDGYLQHIAYELQEDENKTLESPEFVNFALGILKQGVTNDPEIIAKTMHQYLIDHFEYEGGDLDYNVGLKGILYTVQSTKGNCINVAYLYKSLLDAYGVNNRLAFGNFHGKKDYVNHVWNEVLINGQWIPVDNTARQFMFGGAEYKNHIVVYNTNI